MWWGKLPKHARAETAQELIDKAGEATKPPDPPEGGVPKQWLPAIIRWPIRLLIMPFIFLDLFMQKIASKAVPPPFKQVGKCHQRGNCCHYILIEYPDDIWGKLYLFWNTQVNGFYLRSSKPIEHEGKKMLPMGCRYLQKDGRCGQYRLRPVVCRQWPLIEYFGPPQILKGCGFQAVPRAGYKEEEEDKSEKEEE